MTGPSDDPDVRYARGEISREEWQRLRSAPNAPAVAPSLPPRRSTGPLRLLAVLVVVVLAVSASAAFLFLLGLSRGPGTAPVYGSVRRLSSADLATLNASAAHGTAFPGNDSLWFPRGDVNLVVYASPPIHDMAFVIQGLMNPTIHVTAGSRLTVTAVNLDTDIAHNWALSSSGPPFGSMPMMGSGMMVQMSMLGAVSTLGFWGQDVSFTPSAGSFWYLCTVYGHATAGMYGAFDVA